MLAILDYQAGNQTSVARALAHLDIPAVITSNPKTISEAAGVIFPGVGSAIQAMGYLEKSGLDQELKAVVERNQPLLGICLGCQILLEQSEEGFITTLGILPGKSVRFEDALHENGEPIQIPHMGWNSVNHIKYCPLFKNIADDAEFYFVHSYYTRPREDLVLATTSYGRDFCSVFGRNGLWALQFHPEKSAAPGLKILENFHAWCNQNPWQKDGSSNPAHI